MGCFRVTSPVRVLTVMVGAVAVTATAAGQALFVDRLANGTEFVHVAQPLSDATSLSWPPPAGAPGASTTVRSGKLTVVADVEEALAGAEGAPAPSVVVAVGGAPAAELRALLDRVLVTPSAGVDVPAQPALVEGRVERRLGAAGSEASIRLEVTLPAAGDWRRSPVEVLWELVPALVGGDLPGLLSRVDGERGVLEARVDPELVTLRLRRLRLDLARVAAEADFDADEVEAARRRLLVRRKATLENHSQGAETVLGLWLVGGVAAVQEYLFGLDGVTQGSVQRAAQEWLPKHPGAAILALPPRVFSPRFAPAPRPVRLDNDLSAAVLERPETSIAALCVRPVLLPDVDGAIAATILARLAAEVRSVEEAPGWIRVRSKPAELELAAPADSFAELCEVLAVAVRRITGDERPVVTVEADARRRALQLLAALLGLGEGEDLSPAQLLSPGNVALGAVATDGEAAEEAMTKFLAGWAGESRPLDRGSLAAGQRSRVAAPGDRSVLVVVLPLPGGVDVVRAGVVQELLRERAAALLPDTETELLRPLVPGRQLLVLVLGRVGDLDELERTAVEVWPRLVAAPSEEELAPLRRRVAAAVTADSSGALGRARLVAAVAAGELQWRQPAEIELQALTVSSAEVTEIVAGLQEWGSLKTVGAGILPISGR